ncbi:hypothetical protein BGZ94_004921 [Podila epigama]|nr:hypothetical protein BGZ94_004921 [Podila epigama]
MGSVAKSDIDDETESDIDIDIDIGIDGTGTVDFEETVTNVSSSSHVHKAKEKEKSDEEASTPLCRWANGPLITPKSVRHRSKVQQQQFDCNHLFESYRALADHYILHLKQLHTVLTCPESTCRMNFMSAEKLQEHMQAAHSTPAPPAPPPL